MERVILHTTDIPRGTQSIIVSNLHIGQLPKVVCIGLVSSDDYHGHRARNPYNFQHFNTRQRSDEVDGQLFPTKPYPCDFAKHLTLECCDGLLDTLKQRNTPFGELPLNREVFENGFTIFGFDLTSGGTGRGALTLIKQGNLSVAVSFNHPSQKRS